MIIYLRKMAEIIYYKLLMLKMTVSLFSIYLQ